MGIPGIYKQIGPGERVALSKLACEHLEKTGEPFRIAIDISIWSFQIQSGQGGRNPALRTLYYRLLRLLALSIQPLFVFDGPHKPTFKRGKKIAPGAACLPDFLTKELLKRFGFPYHTAPGEAEAECALLQREGIVDAVLSEDVDTLMFGCGMSLRSWTAEGARGNKSPTHVNVYNAETTRATAGLDAHGMILVALMSGGDYVPAGIPGCGPKTACEAAKAGFGQDLCKLGQGDVDGFREWRERLQMELKTNKSKLFRQKHKALTIPESFPDPTVLGYYVRPAVSSAEKVNKLRTEIAWEEPVNVPDLRLFVAEAFNWPCLTGAKKFIRGLAPALLARQLIQRNMFTTGDGQSLEAKESSESRVVKAICGRRSHWNTDGTPELKIAYIPNDIVGIDLGAEEDEDIEGYGNEELDDEQPASGGEDAGGRSRSPTKKRGPFVYDPTEVEKIWVLETYVKLGVPLLVETWEEDMRNPRKFASRKAREKKVLSNPKAVTEGGVMEKFVKISKPGVVKPSAGNRPAKQQENIALPPVFLAPAPADIPRSPQKPTLYRDASSTTPTSRRSVIEKTQPSKSKTKANTSTSQSFPAPLKSNTDNPWTLSKRPSDTLKFRSPTRYSALGIYAPGDPEYDDPSQCRSTPRDPPALASPPASPTPRKRRSRPTTPISDIEPLSRPPQSSPNDPQLTPNKPTSLATPGTRDPAKPSPRKKRSPLEMANELYLAGALKTPTSMRKAEESHDARFGDETGEKLTARKVNRRLDFTTPREERFGVRAISPASETGSLPSPETLLSPTGKEKGKVVDVVDAADSADALDLSSSPSPSSSAPKGRTEPTNPEKSRRFVALRESLEGAWKVLEPWDMGGREIGRKEGVFAAVEVVDLTGC